MPVETTYQPKALTADQLQALSREVKQALTDLYGNRLDRVILLVRMRAVIYTLSRMWITWWY